MKEYATGEELAPEQAKEEMKAGLILTTKDGAERAMAYKHQFAGWDTEGTVRNVLCYLADFTGWYVMEREDWPHVDTATKRNTNMSRLNKVFFE
ncbi:MAG: hypothetical protein LBK61_01395 [Spirochaetaceae bacterium]|nr:hypothetical protein [Spirochaetaceae bacterium]